LAADNGGSGQEPAEYTSQGSAYNALLRQFSDAMQRISRLETRLASFADLPREDFCPEDFVDSPVPRQIAPAAASTGATHPGESPNGAKNDENDRLRRQVTKQTYELALVKDQLKVLKGHRRRRSQKEQRGHWWVAVSRRLGLSQRSG